MDTRTGEIKVGTVTEINRFVAEDPRYRIPLGFFQKGSKFELHGCWFEVLRADFNPGKPGRITLKLKALPFDRCSDCKE
jgi:hypothetical protein